MSERRIGDDEVATFGKGRLVLRREHEVYWVDYDQTDQSSLTIWFRGRRLMWTIHRKEADELGHFKLSGMTGGLNELVGDEYWFELDLSAGTLSYWGNAVLVRVDCRAAP